MSYNNTPQYLHMACIKPKLFMSLHIWDSPCVTSEANLFNIAVGMPYTGVTFATELIMSWNVAFVGTRNLRKRIVLKRRKIAHFYIWHSTFIFDTISTLVFIIQVLLRLLLFWRQAGIMHAYNLWHGACIYCASVAGCAALMSKYVKSATACGEVLLKARASQQRATHTLLTCSSVSRSAFVHVPSSPSLP